MTLMRVPLKAGGQYVVAAAKDTGDDKQPDALEPRDAHGVTHVIDELGGTVEQALDQMVTPAAEMMVSKLRKLSPDALQVEFGIDLSGETGVIIASSALAGHFSVTLTWGQEGLVTPSV
ncbi:CU044_2847 family protein [Leekyejoonella antrihumi]|uniref:Trypsin-co-occurring domain-containing protein n=1 Tax=Leekyejoonella antrihumi TaxID=1660198 RepID=A0A563E6N6_9MICO|nr:CU044_2847 family protein [Leekyejoonella antrihumi]TWP38200.1 hypothetical protein FGL98_02930 [Leekyejoonella antrihumi]